MSGTQSKTIRRMKKQKNMAKNMKKQQAIEIAILFRECSLKILQIVWKLETSTGFKTHVIIMFKKSIR